jgi:CTP synthase (UTP-ammonia lyase)
LDAITGTRHHAPMPTARIALVGDRSPSVRAHTRIPHVIEALRRREGLVLDPYWIPSTRAEGLEGFDGIWVVPGSPYADPERVLAAVRTARELEIPFLGTCGGFQHAALELARGLAGIEDAAHVEYGPSANAVIVALECSLVGHEGAIDYTPGTLLARITGVERSVERYNCAYGIAPGFVSALEHAGVVFSAHDADGAPRALELPGHPFFLGTLFQPELGGDGGRAHPVIRAFADAVAHKIGGLWHAEPPLSSLAAAGSRR